MVTKIFLAGVIYCNRGFTHICVGDIITYLFANYGQVEYQDLVGNWSKLADLWDTSFPFQELVQRFQDIQEFETNGGRTIPDDNTVDKIYTIFYNIWLFYDDCDKWDDKETANTNWEKLQAHFQAE